MWCARFGHGAFTTLDVDAKGVTIRWPLGARALAWSDVEQVVVVGRHLVALGATRRERQLSTLGSMAVGVAGVAVGVPGVHPHVHHESEVDVSWRTADAAADDVTACFERIGRSRFGTSPDIRITGPGGRTFARLRSTHAWEAAEALAHHAAARDVELRVA